MREGQDFEVRDAKTGEDLTRQVLTQIIFEHETKGQGALPLNFLRQLIGFYGGGAQAFLPPFLEMSMNSFTQAQKEWRKASNPMSLFEAQTRRNMALFEQAMQMFVPPTGQAAPDPGAHGASSGQAPGATAGPAPPNPFAGYQAEALAAMQQQMDAFRKQLAELSGKE